MFKRLSVALALAIAGACGGANPVQPIVPANSVTITGSTSGLAPGMKVQLKASLSAAGAAAVDCTSTAVWSSSDEKILAAVSATPGEVIVVDAGDAVVSAVCSGTAGKLPIRIDKPTSWPVSGVVTAGPGGAGIEGATLAFGSLAPVTSAADGRYTIVTPDSSTQRLLISAPGYPTRETYLRGGQLRSLDIDLIAPDMISLWQAMAHNGAESPTQIANVPTQRWTMNPNIYIWTTWKDTGAPVANVDWFAREIRRVIPQLSGFTLQAGVIETGPTQRPQTPGWINIQFHHSGNYGYLGRNPGEVQFAGDSACNYIAVTHEIGHAMGYWHTGMQNTIMGTTPGFCREADLTPNEMRVAKAMYARSPLNYVPDRDASSIALLSALPREGVKITCDRVLR